MDSRSRKAREIYSAINDILHSHWDPIGMNEALPKDEYEAYVGTVYRALVNGQSEFSLISLLTSIENDSIGLRAPLNRKKEAVRRLLALNVRLSH